MINDLVFTHLRAEAFRASHAPVVRLDQPENVGAFRVRVACRRRANQLLMILQLLRLLEHVSALGTAPADLKCDRCLAFLADILSYIRFLEVDQLLFLYEFFQDFLILSEFFQMDFKLAVTRLFKSKIGYFTRFESLSKKVRGFAFDEFMATSYF